jgi:hypothetical protein
MSSRINKEIKKETKSLDKIKETTRSGVEETKK